MQTHDQLQERIEELENIVSMYEIQVTELTEKLKFANMETDKYRNILEEIEFICNNNL